MLDAPDVEHWFAFVTKWLILNRTQPENCDSFFVILQIAGKTNWFSKWIKTDPICNCDHYCWTIRTVNNSRLAFRRRKIHRVKLVYVWSPSPISNIHNLCSRCKESTLDRIANCSADCKNRFRAMPNYRFEQSSWLLPTLYSLSNWINQHCCPRSYNSQLLNLTFGIHLRPCCWPRSMMSFAPDFD